VYGGDHVDCDDGVKKSWRSMYPIATKLSLFFATHFNSHDIIINV
jgi:hypothetical protein